jgi:hypothetical protein
MFLLLRQPSFSALTLILAQRISQARTALQTLMQVQWISQVQQLEFDQEPELLELGMHPRYRGLATPLVAGGLSLVMGLEQHLRNQW